MNATTRRIAAAAVCIAVMMPSATSAKPRELYGQKTCTTISGQIASDRRNGREWMKNGTADILLHTAGCDYDEGRGVYAHREGKYGGGCNLIAFQRAEKYVKGGRNLAADDGSLFGQIWRYVKAQGCRQFEDGTYGPR